MRLGFWFYILVMLLGFQALTAQESPLSNLRNKTVDLAYPQQNLDSLTIIPNSIKIKAIPSYSALDTSSFRLDNTNIIWLIPAEQLPTEIQVSYRVFPFNIGASLSRFDSVDTQKGSMNRSSVLSSIPMLINNRSLIFVG